MKRLFLLFALLASVLGTDAATTSGRYVVNLPQTNSPGTTNRLLLIVPSLGTNDTWSIPVGALFSNAVPTIAGVTHLATNIAFPDTGGTNTVTLWTVPIPDLSAALFRVVNVQYDSDTVSPASFDVSFIAFGDGGSASLAGITTNQIYSSYVGRLQFVTSGSNVLIKAVNQYPATARARLEIMRP